MDIGSYISGYIDGEGCFCISFQPSKRHLLGWEVRPSFSVSQNQERSETLDLILNYFYLASVFGNRNRICFSPERTKKLLILLSATRTGSLVKKDPTLKK